MTAFGRVLGRRWGRKKRRTFTEAQFCELAQHIAEEALAEQLEAKIEEMREYLVREGSARAVLALLEAEGLEPDTAAVVRGWAMQLAKTRMLTPLRVGHHRIVPPDTTNPWP